MRTQAFSAAFVVTAMGGASLVSAQPNFTHRLGANGKPLPASRLVDPIALHADVTCWQAAEPCAAAGCAADAKQVQVRCPPLPESSTADIELLPRKHDGRCMAMVTHTCREEDDCGDQACPPVSCNPPPPQLRAVPCEGEGTAAQVKSVKATLGNGDVIEAHLNGQCEQVPHNAPCVEGVKCEVRRSIWRPCPSPVSLKVEMAPPKRK